MDAEKIGKLIAFLRKQKCWTQKELADKLGISDKTVSKWETGAGLPDISFLPAIADVFDVTVDFIVSTNDVDNFALYESMLDMYARSNNAQNKITDEIKTIEKNFESASKINENLFVEYNVKKGLRDQNGVGVRAGLTKVAEVHGKDVVDGVIQPVEGELFYRGYDVKELVKRCDNVRHRGYEEAVFLLLSGKLPTANELERFCNTLANYRTLPVNFVRDVIMKAPTSDIMNAMSKGVLTLASYDSAVNDTSLPNVMRQSMKLIATFPLLAIYGYQAFLHYRENQSLVIHNPVPEYSTAENILHMLRPDGKFTESEARFLDAALILHAEHGGGNNSTFTTHVVTSSGTDTYSAMTAALCSLKGPKHGGANLKVVQMFDDLKKNVNDWSSLDELYAYIESLLDGKAFDKKGLVYGMGHAVYSLSDPRALVLKGFVKELAEEKGLLDEYKLHCDVETIATELIAKKRRIFKGVSANVDFYSGFAYKMLGLPDELFTPFFAISRVAGWSAHRMEELLNSSKIIRPEYKPIGERKKYIPINKR